MLYNYFFVYHNDQNVKTEKQITYVLSSTIPVPEKLVTENLDKIKQLIMSIYSHNINITVVSKSLLESQYNKSPSYPIKEFTTIYRIETAWSSNFKNIINPILIQNNSNVLVSRIEITYRTVCDEFFKENFDSIIHQPINFNELILKNESSLGKGGKGGNKKK